jgi:polyhydroxyalkanoate synthesis regulator phasin
MAEKPSSSASKTGNHAASTAVVKRPAGHRAVDAQDAIAELTERAQEISREAGTKVSTAMRDVISAAAGLAGFAVESARDLVQYMVRRGQMTTEEGDRLLREAEVAHSRRPAAERKRPTATEVQNKERAIARAKAAAEREKVMIAQHAARMSARPAAKKPEPRPAAKKATKKPAKKAAPKSAPRKAPAKKAKKKGR